MVSIIITMAFGGAWVPFREVRSWKNRREVAEKNFLAPYIKVLCRYVRCIAQGAWFKGWKIATPRGSNGETASTRVPVARELASTRAPNARKYKGATRTFHEYLDKKRVYTREYPFFLKCGTIYNLVEVHRRHEHHQHAHHPHRHSSHRTTDDVMSLRRQICTTFLRPTFATSRPWSRPWGGPVWTLRRPQSSWQSACWSTWSRHHPLRCWRYVHRAVP